MQKLLRRASGQRIRAGVLALALSTVLGGWLLAAPHGASPDDGYHLGSIWCAAGYQDGLCLEDLGSTDPSRALIPQPVTALTCFTYDGSVSAACQAEAVEQARDRLVPTGTNINRVRPNTYYRVMHALIGDGQDVLAAAGRIRTSNTVVTAVMVLLTALVAQPRLRAAFLLTWIVAAVPLGLFLVTSVNTSAWGIAGLTTAWANALTIRDHPTLRNRLAAGGLLALGLALGLGSRTEAVAHVGAITAAIGLMLVLERHDRSPARPGWFLGLNVRQLAMVGAAASVGLAALLAVAPRSAALGGITGDLRRGYGRLAARDVGDPILAIAFEVPTLWAGALGNVWGLGALDTPIPSLASYPLMAVFVTLVALGLHRGHRARIAGVTFMMLALLLIPTLSLLRVGLLVYEQLQPRQFMVLLFPLLGLALYRLRDERPLVLERGGRIAIVVALGIAHSMALLVTIQRHTNGLLPGFLGEPRHVEFGRQAEWWWASAPSPDVVWILVSVAYVVLAATVVRMFAPESRRVA